MPWVLPLLAGLALRLVFFFRFPHIAGDSLLYSDLARNLIQHHTYGLTAAPGLPVQPTLIRLPGYPLFLAACFLLFGSQHYTAVLLVQIAFDLCTCMLLSRLAGSLFGPRAGAAALWLAVLCPFTANLSGAALTETLTLFTIALAFYALERWRRSCVAGAPSLNRWLYVVACALAYSILLRPEQGLLAAAVVPAVFLLARKARVPRSTARGFKPAFVLALLTVLPLAPWAARNAYDFHVFQPLAPRFANDPGEFNPAGFERWYRTWAVDYASTEDVYWHFDGNSIDLADLPDRTFDSERQLAATEQLLDDYNVDTTATPELDARFASLADERIASHPVRFYLALPLARVGNMVFRPRVDMLPVALEWWRFRAHRGVTLFASFYAAVNLFYFILAGVTIMQPRLWRSHRILVAAMLLTVVFRLALLLTIDNSEPRYTLEFFPVIIVLGSAAFSKLSGR